MYQLDRLVYESILEEEITHQLEAVWMAHSVDYVVLDCR
jgi:hypothetical protein